jgi:hypothetical protein
MPQSTSKYFQAALKTIWSNFFRLLALPGFLLFCYMKILSVVLFVLVCSQPQPRYLFFLHNRFIEAHGPLEQHPTYGRAEYKEILEHFRKDGFVVLSEKRPANADERAYAGKVAGQIDSLLKHNVAPSHITVVGTSKGGYIAQFVSALCENPNLNFVFVGSSFQYDPPEIQQLTLFGRVLSITEASDTSSIALSTQSRFKRSQLHPFAELTLHTGLHHGFLFKALDDWILPAENWANQADKDRQP